MIDSFLSKVFGEECRQINGKVGDTRIYNCVREEEEEEEEESDEKWKLSL